VSSWTMILFEEDARVHRRDDTHWALLELAVRHYWRQAPWRSRRPFQRIAREGVKLESPNKPQAIGQQGGEGLLHRMFHLPGRQAPGPDWAPLSIKVLDA
jgi:hypothetical protein